MKEIKLELPIADLSGVCKSMNELKKAVEEYGKRDVIVRLGTALIESGVKCSAIIEGSNEEVILDFSEHDKMVAEEKDKRIAELEEMRNHLWEVGETQQRKRLEAEEEASELRKELISKNERMIELINEATEEREEKGYYKEKLSLLRTRCMEEARDDFDADRYGSLVIRKPEPSYEAERIAELEDRHQSDCIRINQLLTTIDVLTERYQKLREIHGL